MSYVWALRLSDEDSLCCITMLTAKFFKSPNSPILLRLVFFLCVPVANASVERVFSILKSFWKDDRYCMRVQHVQAERQVKWTSAGNTRTSTSASLGSIMSWKLHVVSWRIACVYHDNLFLGFPPPLPPLPTRSAIGKEKKDFAGLFSFPK